LKCDYFGNLFFVVYTSRPSGAKKFTTYEYPVYLFYAEGWGCMEDAKAEGEKYFYNMRSRTAVRDWEDDSLTVVD
jgi:hypothetical protein